jgi:acyl-coenzyme A synthetase/AMP-(fatty) acid ligase
MAHYFEPQLKRPTSFNFATDVVDYWAEHAPAGGCAMHWVSQDRNQERRLSFEHFSRQSHRLAVLLRETLGLQRGEKMLMIMPRLPEW